MAQLSTEWVAAALQTTGHFEDSDSPWSAVSDNFDGMGVSLGVLQWNFGQGSLQRLVKKAGREAVLAAMPLEGQTMWGAINASPSAWRAIIAHWFNGTALKSAVRSELKAFTSSDAFIAQQIAGADTTAKSAWIDAEAWAMTDPDFGTVTKALFCWFFDLATQNGGLKQVSYANLKAFHASHSDAVDFVCDWLAGQPSSVAGYRDAHDNSLLWRAPAAPQEQSLFLLSYLRCLKSKPAWQVDTLNRKGTIARGTGWVHREKHDLAGLLNL